MTMEYVEHWDLSEDWKRLLRMLEIRVPLSPPPKDKVEVVGSILSGYLDIKYGSMLGEYYPQEDKIRIIDKGYPLAFPISALLSYRLIHLLNPIISEDSQKDPYAWALVKILAGLTSKIDVKNRYGNGPFFIKLFYFDGKRELDTNKVCSYEAKIEKIKEMRESIDGLQNSKEYGRFLEILDSLTDEIILTAEEKDILQLTDLLRNIYSEIPSLDPSKYKEMIEKIADGLEKLIENMATRGRNECEKKVEGINVVLKMMKERRWEELGFYPLYDLERRRFFFKL